MITSFSKSECACTLYMYTCTCTCVYIVHVRFLVNIHDHIHVHVHVHVYKCRNHVSLSLTIPGSCWDCWFPMTAPHLTQSAVTLSGRAGLISGWHIGELTPGTFLLVYNACLCTYIVRVLYTVHFEHMYNPSSIFLPPLSIILPLQHHLFPLSPSFCSSLIPSPSLCPPPPLSLILPLTPLPSFIPSSLLVQLSHHTLRGNYHHSDPEDAFESAIHSVNRPSDLQIVWLEYLSYLRENALKSKSSHNAFKVLHICCAI